MLASLLKVVSLSASIDQIWIQNKGRGTIWTSPLLHASQAKNHSHKQPLLDQKLIWRSPKDFPTIAQEERIQPRETEANQNKRSWSGLQKLPKSEFCENFYKILQKLKNAEFLR